jgi:putative inorganic carbon (HCO3(-)) transporter
VGVSAFALLCLALAVPEWIFPLSVFLLPLLNLTPHPTLVLAFLLAIGVGSWTCKLFCGHRDVRFGVLDACVLWFGVLILSGGIFSAGGRASTGEGFVRFVLLLSYFPIKEMMSHAHWRRRVLRALTLALTVTSVFGVWQYLAGRAELKWVDVSRFSDIGGRVTSFFENPNVLATFLLLCIPTVLGAWTDEKGGGLSRRLPLGAVVAGVGCLILTWSRGAWLGAIASILLFLLLRSSASRRLLLWSGLPIFIWLPLLPQNVVNRFSSIGMLTEGSIRYRLYTWQSVCRMLAVHPFGIGGGEAAFTAVYSRFAISGTEMVMHAHNLLLQIALEMGFVGLLTFFLLMVSVLCSAVRVWLHWAYGVRIGLLSGAFCALVGVMIMGFFDYVWYHNGLFWLFWVMLATLVGSVRLATDREWEVDYAEGG